MSTIDGATSLVRVCRWACCSQSGPNPPPLAPVNIPFTRNLGSPARRVEAEEGIGRWGMHACVCQGIDFIQLKLRGSTGLQTISPLSCLEGGSPDGLGISICTGAANKPRLLTLKTHNETTKHTLHACVCAFLCVCVSPKCSNCEVQHLRPTAACTETRRWDAG